MKQVMIEAFELKQKGYYKQAIEIFYKLLAKENDNIEILSELGELYLLLKNYDRAINYTNKALEINNSHIHSLSTACKIYIEKKEYEQASKIANKIYIITNNQDDLFEFVKLLNLRKKYNEVTGFADFINSANVGMEIAFAYYQLGKYDEAIQILTTINAPKDFTAHLNLLCKIYFKTKKIEHAKEVLKKLENKELRDAETINYNGLAKLADMEFDEAINYFKSALDINPQKDEYNYNIGQAYFLKGWLDEAKDYFVKALCINPNESTYEYALGYVLYREGDYQNALSHLNNDLLESKVLAMLIKYQTGDLATAKSELEKLLQENPNNETIIYGLAQIYAGLELYKQAIDMTKQAIDINPKSLEYKVFLANLMLKTKNYDAVKPIIEELNNTYPKYYPAKVLYAELVYNIQEYDLLFNIAQELIELDMNHFEGYYYNALALVEKNDINFAIESLKKAITLDVNNASLYVKMSEIYQALGRYEDAFEYIKEASDIDKSARNQELYRQLAGIIRKHRTNK